MYLLSNRNAPSKDLNKFSNQLISNYVQYQKGTRLNLLTVIKGVRV